MCLNHMAAAPTACPMHSGSAISSPSEQVPGTVIGSIRAKDPGCHRGSTSAECVGGSACQTISVASLAVPPTLMLTAYVAIDHTNLASAAPSYVTSPPSPPPQA